MNTDTASEVCYELALAGCFSTSQFADRAGILGWGDKELVELLESVPGIKRISPSWWRYHPSKMWKAVRRLGYAVVVAFAIALLM